MKTALTDRAIKAMKPATKAYDMHDVIVPGLALRVLPSGVKSFVLIARFPGSRNPTRRSLGQYGELTLEAARAKARQWLELIARSIDPAEEVKRQRREQERKRAATFEAVVEDYIRVEVYGPGGEKRPKHRTADKTVTALRGTLVPLFGHRPITELTAPEILRPLELIGQIGSDRALLELKARKQLVRPGRKRRPALSQARSLFAFMEMVLNWASEPDAHYGLERSPLERVRVSRYFGRAETREHVLNDDELATLQVATSRLAPPHRQMYGTLLHSGLRLGEVARARWGELEGDVWIIPAERMKGRSSQAKPHAVPITGSLRNIFDSLPRGKAGDFIFSCDGGRSPMVTRGTTLKERLDRVMRQAWQERMQARGKDPAETPLRPWRNHDVRRSVRSSLSRLGVRHEVAEAVLAHARGGMVGTYDRWAYLPEKRDALERWSKFLAGLTRPRSMMKDEQATA
jgi:integrase